MKRKIIVLFLNIIIFYSRKTYLIKPHLPLYKSEIFFFFFEENWIYLILISCMYYSQFG
ncbi:hypothetical protein GLOIN_2v1490143 [Rhizophagus irregularis DAOM 181602=DAOM 197198]|uniref:Uncharacterized protein n=1 Tax=Rhizophagus irregularis (strain DAOM 181602 / DAOM 197198 / MUCL 43194) TaxID=747089 RepID=A0A2P4QZV4_RHIID|nr:hypothetical protein GLOIN_2v1490143 [Rhizophagus irregularis DAOM 181602=DAOM 197198]POG83183.1 hypothetical protein GLOIN_2v1490143 [Rhizophagus irregularis DAOM 181602=DAOM 197198]|eukprot:XP_025190049.1 hypothetical protein GLOIN_2v1490143 [Rhizophagus irregularis DAOM 181602=DAOM 197198]